MIQIRRAVQRDADAIARLAAESAAEEGLISVLDLDRVKAHAFGGNALFEAWVAEQRQNQNKPIGHAIITKSYDVRRAVPTIVLCELYVAPSHRRTGAARLLMSAVARRSRDLGARELTITTGVDNAVAQRFFSAVGAHSREARVFVMSADGIEWLASEGL
jgi:GNAT superfamily N-acetyltransferase